MTSLLARLLLTAAALCCGVTLGYFVLDFPIIPVATKSVVEWFIPLVRHIDVWLYARGLQYLLVAALIFVATVPNIALLSFLVALSMRAIRRPRSVFYTTLIWPAIHYFLDMEKALRIMAALERLHLKPDLDLVLRAENTPTKAFGMLLVYSLFSVLVFFFYRKLSHIRHKPTLNLNAPTSGASAS